ncbi:MAG: nucleoside hydrolase [Lentisphaerota bacterium]
MDRIPVILDTDIGEDIDDLWALCYLLKCPELDLKLVLTDLEDTVYRAKVVCKFLEIAGRTDVPVGIGIRQPSDPITKTHAQWIEDYELDKYRGNLRRDGVDAMIEIIRASATPITIICICPMPNIKAALEKAPDIAPKCRFVGMMGSIKKRHSGVDGAIAENNIVRDLPASKALFAAQWLSFSITPLDSCGNLRLQGEKYQAVKNCKNPATAALIENYRLWSRINNNFESCSSILYDTVAVYLAFSTEYLEMEKLKLIVNDAGFTLESNTGVPVDVAIGWKDIGAFENHLVERLTN